jgi:hypothetical protein
MFDIFGVGAVFAVNAWFCSQIKYGVIPKVPNYVFTVIPKLSVVFFTIATILNLNTWTIYFFKIGEMANKSRNY